MPDESEMPDDMLLSITERRRRQWIEEWDALSEEKRQQLQSKHEKHLAHLEGLIRQVKARIERSNSVEKGT